MTGPRCTREDALRGTHCWRLKTHCDAQASPDDATLAAGFRGRLSSSGKKKMSRLKRVILRERAENNARDAAAAAEAAAAIARAESAKHAGFVARLQARPCLV